MTQPAPPKNSCLGNVIAMGGVGVSLFWLLNFTMGIVEIPDNLPFVGNVDEAVAAGLLFASLRYLGIDLIPFGNRKRKEPQTEKVEIRYVTAKTDAHENVPRVEVVDNDGAR